MAQSQDGSLKSRTPKPSLSARRYVPPVNRLCNQEGGDGLEGAGEATLPEHGHYDVDGNEGGPVEQSAVDSSPDPQEAPADSATRPELDNDKSSGDYDNVNNNKDDQDDDSRLHDLSIPLAEIEVTDGRADTPETECDTQADSPAQLPSPPKYPSPPRSCHRRGRAVYRVGSRARGDGDTGPLRRL